MTLKDYYNSLERPVPPKKSFIKEVAEKCGVDDGTVRFWVRGSTKPSNPDHVIILSELTGIDADKLWSNEIH